MFCGFGERLTKRPFPNKDGSREMRDVIESSRICSRHNDSCVCFLSRKPNTSQIGRGLDKGAEMMSGDKSCSIDISAISG